MTIDIMAGWETGPSKLFFGAVIKTEKLYVNTVGGVSMDTKIIRDEMIRLDKISGLDTSMVPIRISSRMTRGWGLCSCTKVGRQFQVREIVFAKRLLEHRNIF